MWQVWSELLLVPPDNRSALLFCLAEVLTLPAEIRKRVESDSSIGHEVYLKWLPSVEAALSILHLDQQWAQCIDKFDASVIYGIEVVDELLSRTQAEQTLDTDQLKQIHDEVSSLLKEVYAAADLDPAIRNFIIHHLEAVERAILNYRLRGAAPLRREVEAR